MCFHLLSLTFSFEILMIFLCFRLIFLHFPEPGTLALWRAQSMTDLLSPPLPFIYATTAGNISSASTVWLAGAGGQLAGRWLSHSHTCLVARTKKQPRLYIKVLRVPRRHPLWVALMIGHDMQVTPDEYKQPHSSNTFAKDVCTRQSH